MELTHPWSNSDIFYSCQLGIRNPLHSHRYEWRERGWHSSDGWHMGGSQLPSYAACVGLPVLLFLSLRWNTSILWWVIAGPAWPYNLVYLTEPAYDKQWCLWSSGLSLLGPCRISGAFLIYFFHFWRGIMVCCRYHGLGLQWGWQTTACEKNLAHCLFLS